jgi:hypothetical protein
MLQIIINWRMHLNYMNALHTDYNLDSIKTYFYTFINIETNNFAEVIDKINRVMKIKNCQTLLNTAEIR